MRTICARKKQARDAHSSRMRHGHGSGFGNAHAISAQTNAATMRISTHGIEVPLSHGLTHPYFHAGMYTNVPSAKTSCSHVYGSVSVAGDDAPKAVVLEPLVGCIAHMFPRAL